MSNNFIKCYTRDIALLKGTKNHLLLFELFKLVNGLGHIHLNSHLKNQIAKNIGVTLPRIDQLLREYKQKDLTKPLGEKGSGSYMLNPYLFFKGSEDSVSKFRAIYSNITKVEISYCYDSNGVKMLSRMELTEPETGEIITLKNDEIFI